MDSEAPPSSPSPSPGSPRRSIRTRRRRLYRILRARLTTPILTPLLLLPVLPSSQLNLIFQLVPFARSARALLFPVNANAELHAMEMSQWLAYWLLYAGVRLLESTRFRLDSLKEVQHLVRIVPRFLFSSAVAKLSARSTPTLVLSTAASASTSMTVMTRAQQRRQRTQTLAAQLAGTPLRWTLFKSVLLFYAMDEELQGARWILEKLAKPCAAFFTGLEGAAAGSRRASRRAKIGDEDSDSEGQDMARLGERQCERQRRASKRGKAGGKRDVVLGSSTGTGTGTDTGTGTGTAGPEDAAQVGRWPPLPLLFFWRASRYRESSGTTGSC